MKEWSRRKEERYRRRDQDNGGGRSEKYEIEGRRDGRGTETELR